MTNDDIINKHNDTKEYILNLILCWCKSVELISVPILESIIC